MSLAFQLQGSTAVDSAVGIEIFYPRIVPEDGPFSFGYECRVEVRGRSDGFGLSATSTTERAGMYADNHTFVSFDSPGVLSWMIDRGEELGCVEDEYAFVAQFAKGMALAFSSVSTLYTNHRYSIVVSDAALRRSNIGVPEDVRRMPDGRIVLAEVYIPCRGGPAAGA